MVSSVLKCSSATLCGTRSDREITFQFPVDGYAVERDLLTATSLFAPLFGPTCRNLFCGLLSRWLPFPFDSTFLQMVHELFNDNPTTTGS